MAKKENAEVAHEETKQAEQKANPVADVIKSIAALSQTDRLVLYNRLDVIINHDRDKASQGIDGGTHLFDEAINSL
jgi:hypothetical protein